MHHVATMPKMACSGNFGNGPLLIDALRDSLILIFGEEQYTLVREDVVSGRDSYFNVPEDIARDFEHELYLEDNNLKVEPRSKRKYG